MIEELTREEIELMKAQVELQILQSKAESAKFQAIYEMYRLRPCHVYPVRVYHNDVTWVCESTSCENAVGCGDSPKEAQQAFDDMWMGFKRDGDCENDC